MLHGFVLIEAVKEGLVDGLVHPVFGLLGTMGVEIAVLFGEGDVFLDVVPHFHDAGMIDRGAADCFGTPS